MAEAMLRFSRFYSANSQQSGEKTISTQRDPEFSSILKNETERQKHTINLIASENYASRAVLEAQGSLFTNKYAEGYPGGRYYGGCSNMDAVENLAIERARKLFGAEHANVQPHSGTQANMGVYHALLEVGDTVLAMSLSHGGHLSHGDHISFSGRYYKFVHYGVSQGSELLDYDQIEKQALECRPRMIIAGASAYPRLIDFARFRAIADKVGALLLVDMAHIAGLIAAGIHPSPVSYADVVTSSTHKTLRGPRSGFILCRQQYASKIDSGVFPGIQGGPLMHAIAAKAVGFYEAMQPEFVEYQHSVVRNAAALADELKQAGLRLVSGGTDNHLVLVDLNSTGLTGRMLEQALESVNIQVNRNAIPYDPKPPRIASGIRLGTPAMTTRSFGTGEFKRVAQLMVKVLSSPDDARVRKQVSAEVADLCKRFPIPDIA
ncbi:MAG: serine hydroxymethyltransferase [Chloroflexota bacterium]